MNWKFVWIVAAIILAVVIYLTENGVLYHENTFPKDKWVLLHQGNYMQGLQLVDSFDSSNECDSKKVELMSTKDAKDMFCVWNSGKEVAVPQTAER